MHVTIQERMAHAKYILVWKCLTLKALHSVRQAQAYYAQKLTCYIFFPAILKIITDLFAPNIPSLFLWQVTWLYLIIGFVTLLNVIILTRLAYVI